MHLIRVLFSLKIDPKYAFYQFSLFRISTAFFLLSGLKQSHVIAVENKTLKSINYFNKLIFNNIFIGMEIVLI